MAITTQTAVENYLLITIDPSFTDQLTEWINAVELYMDKATDRKLIADTVDTEYVYGANREHKIVVDDFQSITKVEAIYSLDGTRTDITSDCYFYPTNKVPKFIIECLNHFPRGRQNVIVTGKRGYSTQANLPADLKLAATILLAGIVNASYSSAGVVTSEAIGSYHVTYSTDTQKNDYSRALETLKQYRRYR